MIAEMETDPPIKQSRIARIAKRMGEAAYRSLDAMKLVTDRLMSLLRLFGTIGLTLIVSLVVYKAIQSTDVVVVKPFSVPKAIQDISPDSGRIIATQLDAELKEAELLIYNTIKGSEQAWQGRSRTDHVELAQITGSAGDFLLGSNIKLPETGISINDVVEFIASVFGRRNIIGSIYQDQGKLHLRVELDGQVFSYERPLDASREKSLNFDLIEQMLEESRADLLSAASPQHNLYYYCSGKTDRIFNQDSRFAQWFDYCARLNNPQGNIEELTQLFDTLNALNADSKAATEGNLILSNVLNNTLANARERLQSICPDYEQTKVCQPHVDTAQPTIVAAQPTIAAMIAVEPTSAPPIDDVQPLTEPSTHNAGTPDAQAPEAVTVTASDAVDTSANPPDKGLVSLAELQDVWAKCSDRVISSSEVLASNRSEAEATFLFNNKLIVQAVEKYREALQQNCRNAFAWANLGVLLNVHYQSETAVFALATASGINNRADWIPNSWCIAQAYNGPPAQMIRHLTEAKSNDPCGMARAINPANRVILDKQFYLAVADRFFDVADYAQAAETYQIALSVDRKRDCVTAKAVSRLHTLEVKHNIKGAWQAACAIRDSAVPLADGKISSCEPELVALQCPAT